MKIGFLGDIHQHSGAARFALYTFNALGVDTVVQVGDYGIGADRVGQYFDKRVQRFAEQFGVTLYVVPGNHENWERINLLTDGSRQTWAQITQNVFLAPRGIRWTWDGMSFVALGGAPSVDRTYRRKLIESGRVYGDAPWYPEEQITQEDVDYVVAGGYADVMVAHDAPSGVPTIDKAIDGNPHGFNMIDVRYAEDGRRLITEAFRGVGPKYFFHGHYHIPVNDYIQRPNAEYGEQTRIVGLDCNFRKHTMAVLDTETGEVERIDNTTHLFRYRKEWG